MAGRVTIQASLNELPQGSVTIAPLTISPNTQNLYGSGVYTLAEGANSIIVPDFAAGVIITPTATNTIAITLKGASGDTGIPISPSAPILLTFPADPPETITLTAASDFSTPTTFSFF